ncbi:MAG: hypothetical protein MUC89_22600 [Acetobacteraceae bacterium]|jgi:hypothetical protein|nr:hypothetical protein [Acetobacteraceae bacterium]
MQILALLLGLLLAFPAAAAPPPALTVTLVGDAEAVFVRRRDGCGRFDTPDAPARAVRTPAGVALFATHFDNRALRGPSLRDLRPDCVITFAGAENPDPAAFSDRSWIAALWTRDGLTIHALVHNEHQGHRHAGQCPTRRYRDCWFNALTAVVSHDAGLTFRPAGPAPSLVAALPYRADEMQGRPAGYYNPTGIVEHENAMYFMAFASGREAQRHGNCLVRTDTIADPSSWRAWDGAGFSVRFANPYAADAPQGAARAAHVCAPVGRGRLQWPVTALVRHAPSGQFIAVMQGGPHRPEHAVPAPGVYIATSADLLTWSAPAFVMPGIGHGRFRCGDAPPIAYPSLLDPDSDDPSFATVGDTAWLLFTRFNVPDCRITSDRDLIRIAVTITPGEAAMRDGSAAPPRR